MTHAYCICCLFTPNRQLLGKKLVRKCRCFYGQSHPFTRACGKQNRRIKVSVCDVMRIKWIKSTWALLFAICIAFWYRVNEEHINCINQMPEEEEKAQKLCPNATDCICPCCMLSRHHCSNSRYIFITPGSAGDHFIFCTQCAHFFYCLHPNMSCAATASSFSSDEFIDTRSIIN